VTSPIERQRLQEGMRVGVVSDYPLHHWRFYFAYLLGRPFSLAETEEFLQQEAQDQRTLHRQGTLV
jgi:hypothetical protein